ncbi:MAG TPA: ATP-binding protein [Bacteroidales bacterium]|nr:ATP-binding protein [Bacteroidales bacterium]
MIGVNGADMVGKTMEELFPFEFARKISMDDWMVVQSNQVINVDENLNDRNYTTFKYPILLGERNLLAGYTIEITERIKAEHLINEQNAELKKLNADKDRFISILAHDLKNPFNALLGLSDLILKNIDTYNIDRTKSLIVYINQIAQNTYDLLNDLLAWSKNQAGMLPFMPEKILLADICNEIIDNYKISFETKEIVAEYAGDCGIYVYADVFMLKTIVRNLLANAIKFTNKGGHINIKTEIKDKEALITISDNGIGISSENMAKLWGQSCQFSTVGTAKEEGTGFGLLLCKDFVEKHGGKIIVKSEVGKGSDFQFNIPLYIE